MKGNIIAEQDTDSSPPGPDRAIDYKMLQNQSSLFVLISQFSFIWDKNKKALPTGQLLRELQIGK